MKIINENLANLRPSHGLSGILHVFSELHVRSGVNSRLFGMDNYKVGCKSGSKNLNLRSRQ
jgi:hypothetical protein